MSDTTTTLDITRERVARRTATARRMLMQQSGGHPQTPDMTADQIDLHGPHLLMLARVVVDTWVTCGGAVPQQLSDSIIDLKKAIQSATASQEVADA